MTIRELCERIGITKRNVYFYIKEGLAAPAVLPENGYYDFSEEDFKRLFMVHELRNAGLSIPEIRYVLDRPSASNYYLRKYKTKLERELRRLERIANSVEYILENLPVNPSFDNVYDLVLQAGIPGEKEDLKEQLQYENYDNHLVNQMLWRSFLPEGKLTAYQQYHWDRINHMTSIPNNEDYRKLTEFMHSLDSEAADALFYRIADYTTYIAGLNYEACINYAIRQRKRLTEFVENEKAISYWKSLYDSYFAPSVRIYASDIRIPMAEISPFFASYEQNVILTCEMIYRWLYSTDGYPLLCRLQEVLGEYLNLEEANHGQIECLTVVMDMI